jgi:hypothetical protein
MMSDPSDFDSLRKLMRLKRYEQPPPGYFSQLPDKIMMRLERGEGEAGFWDKLVSAFAFRPALAYGFALSAFGALTLSVFYTVKSQPGEYGRVMPRNFWRTELPGDALAAQITFNPAEPLHVANWMGNTNPSAASNLPSLFGSGAREQALHVNFASPP